MDLLPREVLWPSVLDLTLKQTVSGMYEVLLFSVVSDTPSDNWLAWIDQEVIVVELKLLLAPSSTI